MEEVTIRKKERKKEGKKESVTVECELKLRLLKEKKKKKEKEGKVFANGLGDLGSIPRRVIPKTLKMVLDTS